MSRTLKRIYAVSYLLAAELFLWAVLNNWQVNAWLAVNATVIVFTAWSPLVWWAEDIFAKSKSDKENQ